MKALSPPFRLARSGITSTGWIEGEPDAPGQALAIELADWDAAVDLAVHRHLSVDRATVGRETGLASGSRLRLASGWFCETTRTRRVVHVCSLELPGAEDTALELSPHFHIPGRVVARSVRLESRLTLVHAAPGGSRISARLPGSILWHEDQCLALESSRSRFPMEWADFRSSVYNPNSAWALDWDPQDLESSTLGSVLLLINQNNQPVARLLREEPPTEASKILWDTIHFDVARQLIEGALSNEEFIAMPNSYPDGSLGATIRRMIATYFPYHDIGTLRVLRTRSRPQFETLMQAQLGLYKGK